MLAPVLSTQEPKSLTIELVDYLVNPTGPVPLVVDLCIAHERWGSSSDPSLNGHLHYPNDVDGSRNETTNDKIRIFFSTRFDYNRPSTTISFIPVIASTSGRLHSEFVCLLFLHVHRKTYRFFTSSGVQLAQSTSDQFH